MKRFISFMLVLTLMFMITVPVSAEYCDFEKEKNGLGKIEVKANYKDDSFAFTVSINNISNKYYVLDSYGNRYESINNKMEINPKDHGQYFFVEGIEYNLFFFGNENSNCNDGLIYNTGIQSLVKNTIKDDELCKKNSNFYLCNDYIHIEDIEKDFVEEFNKDNSSSNYNEEENKNLIVTDDFKKVMDIKEDSSLIIRIGVAIVFLIILILLFIKYKKSRGGK